MTHEKAMKTRSLPLAVSVGLAWWLVLAAYPPSRPLVIYEHPGLERVRAGAAHEMAPTVVAAGLFALHAVLLAWFGLILLRRAIPHGVIVTTATMLLALWLAATTWIIAAKLAGSIRGGYGMDWEVLPIALLAAPMAFSFYWRATWILFPLAAVTLVVLHRMALRGPSARGASPTG
jgi:hypothetical protein